MVGVYTPASEHFQVEGGSGSSSLLCNVPCCEGGASNVPETGGGLNGAQPCLVAANRERGVVLTKKNMRQMIARNRTSPPSLRLNSTGLIAVNDQAKPLAYLHVAICSALNIFKWIVQAMCHCERYWNGTSRLRGNLSFRVRRMASTLLSPMVKAIMEPMIIPQMPPRAIPSRNIRLRKNGIVVTFSLYKIRVVIAGRPLSWLHSRGVRAGNIPVLSSRRYGR